MNLLVLDDDQTMLQAISIALGSKHKIFTASNFAQAEALLEREDIEGAIVDIDLGEPGRNGVDFLKLFKNKFPEKPVLMESGYNDVPTVVKCMQLGADDYLEKPYDARTLDLRITRIFANSKKVQVLSRQVQISNSRHQIVGSSPGILRAKNMIEQAQSMRVLLYGETGVGKTPFAHWSSQVVSKITGEMRPFEQLNCACLNKEHFQDLLFGHKKGAFTGAISDKKGLVELAQGGDLFLDEIGDMPLETQALFLTFMDSMEYYRLGDDRKRTADVRFICATNKDLKKLVAEGKFRQDLYSRISQVVVPIPALRDRVEDIPALFEHFVQLNCGYAKPYDPKLIDLLKDYSWEEGNVRELRDAVEFICIMSRESEKIEVQHMGERYRPFEGSRVPQSNGSDIVPQDISGAFEYGLEDFMGSLERKILETSLKNYSGNLESMARKLQISRPTLYRRLKKYAIPTDIKGDLLH